MNKTTEELFTEAPEYRYPMAYGALSELMSMVESELSIARKYRKHVSHKRLANYVKRAKEIDALVKKAIEDDTR